ncbi:MAG: type I restriction enzyme HsdR N-terminal domain-containing protein [Bacteroidales bacterium]|nr:type I restriction enzyme HsdR N-terminal domain-containing protein [Bacteroidales bacterium]
MNRRSMPQETVYDPLRRREVALTPEERVRQWFIGVLSEEMGVPMHLMMSEVALTLPSGKPQRADIVVWGRNAEPLVIVECKRPDVTLDAAVADQALRYNNILNVRYIIVTSGVATYAFGKKEDRFEPLARLPLWTEM